MPIVTKSEGVTVTLDGEPVEDFVSASAEDGWVRVSPELVRRGKVEIGGSATVSPRASRFSRAR